MTKEEHIKQAAHEIVFVVDAAHEDRLDPGTIQSLEHFTRVTIKGMLQAIEEESDAET